MSELWMVPDEDEPEYRDRRHGHLPALPICDQRSIAYRVRLARALPVGDHNRIIDLIGRDFGVTGRTAQRYANRSYPCPGPRCMTNVRGGGLCSFCRRTR